ncbi:MAG TPA: riboflavin synthase [Candidatus Saccharimonadales bacterium]|nr:riboflavin synthase [Candidatus Saccharimonadales bacterium]
MFSGIVERVGRVESSERDGSGAARLVIRADFTSAPAAGASVAVNGVCLTVERFAEGAMHATAVPETLARTTLGTLERGSRVNLERALRVGDEIGGHWVQGHVDQIARVAAVRRAGADVLVQVEVPAPLRRYVALKGSLTLDGVSLTVAAWEEPRATVALVPYTLEHTIASEYHEGSAVNLEVDLLARYLERLAVSRGLLDPLAPGRP